MRYNIIRRMDIANGPGIRVSIFVQGCTHKCQGCFNPETWDFYGGKDWTIETNERILTLMDNPTRVGLSILGGDPFCLLKYRNPDEPNLLLELLKEFKKRFPDKNIWLWTGYTFEQFFPNRKKDTITFDNELYMAIKECLPYIDVIVDGPFIENLKDMRLKYAGSLNQRVIDLQKSMEQNEVILFK